MNRSLSRTNVIEALNTLIFYCEDKAWTGPDPFDGLLSQRVPKAFLRTKKARQLQIQLRKRFPWNLGPLLGIPSVRMAKTAGTASEGLVCAFLATENQYYCEIAERLLKWVIDERGIMTASGRRAWGYEFDVQTRWGFYPNASPNIIATSFVGRALLLVGQALNNQDFLKAGVEAAQYVAEELVFSGKSGPFFRYTPNNEQLIHNANLLGVALIAEAATEASSPNLQTAIDCAETSVKAQTNEGWWPYGEDDALKWNDNFHTAYNLDGLLALNEAGYTKFEAALKKGADFWERAFFDLNGAPRYFPHRSTPYDVHSAGTALAVGSKLARKDYVSDQLPWRVWDWTEKHLKQSNGSFAYQRTRVGVNRTTYMRWGQAHILRGLGQLLLNGQDTNANPKN